MYDIDRAKARELGYTDEEIDSFLKKVNSNPQMVETNTNTKPINEPQPDTVVSKYLDQTPTPDPTPDNPQLQHPLLGNTPQPTPTMEPVEITQTFMQPSQYDTQTGGINYGVDYATPPGTDLSLPEGDWEVENAYNGAGPGNINDWTNQGYGNSVMVKNRKTGEKLRFSHLQEANVTPGQLLGGGNIGKTGGSGHVTGPHLDFEMYDAQGNPTDPLKSPYGNIIPHR